MIHILPFFLYGTIFATLWMIATWGFYFLKRNPTILDLGGVLCVGAVSALYFAWANTESWPLFLIFLFTLIWSLRLGLLLTYRIFQKKLDGRYLLFNKRLKDHLPQKYFWFSLFSAFWVVVITLPIAIEMAFPKVYWHGFQWIGLIFMGVGLIGTSIADIQLQAFLRKHGQEKTVCNTGLWRYSRHPNYFFECIFWMGQAIACLSAPFGFLGFLSPILMCVLLLFFTGIPLAEEQALKRRKQAYRSYQKETSKFIPWWPKKPSND